MWRVRRVNEMRGERMLQQSTGLQLRSTVKKEGILELSLTSVPIPEPKPEEVVVRVDASPINPSDLGLMFGGADMSTAKVSGTLDNPIVTASIPPPMMKSMIGRMDQSLPVGNEGAGVVVRTGSADQAQALMGKTVAILGGARYAQFRCIKASQCLVLPRGTTPAEGASCFVNPLTALGMIETMRAEGHSGLVHTAAASNLGQMLNKLCIKDGSGLVNIVRKQEHVDVLKAIGAKHVVNSSAPTFIDDLIEALVATGATLAFDAIGGGRLASQILSCMEAAANRTAKGYSRYGSTTHRRTSRCTSMAAWTEVQRNSCATSAWRGASAAGCLSRFCRRSVPRWCSSCESESPPRSRRPSPATTTRRCPSRRRCNRRRSRSTARKPPARST